MFLKKVEITNFKSYYGKNIFDFGRDLSSEGRRIYLIGGLNGAGKTSFLEAITLGLLGQNVSFLSFDERSQQNIAYPTYKIMLQENFSKRATVDGDLQMSVRLIFEDKGGELVIERKWWFDESGSFSDENLDVYINGAPLPIEKEADPKELKNEFIETKIPPQITKFFFFDGEEIRKIADKSPSTSVREGLNSLLGFAMLNRLIEDMDTVRKEIRAETGKSSTKADLLQAEKELSEKKEEKERILEELDESRRHFDKLKEDFEIANIKISSLTGGDATLTRERIEEEIEELLQEESRIGSEIGRLVGDFLFVAMPRTLLNKL
jgi:DNA sulfur modification protein DndD